MTPDGLQQLRTGVLETGRFRLEPLRPSHAAEMVEVLSDPGLYRFIGGGPPTLAELQARFEHQMSGPDDADQAWLNWIVRRIEDRRALGYVQATLSRSGGAWVADVAWVIGVAHQGAGVASEASGAVLASLRRHGVTEIRAHIADGNRASVRVAERSGMLRTDVVDAEGERLYVGRSQ